MLLLLTILTFFMPDHITGTPDSVTVDATTLHYLIRKPSHPTTTNKAIILLHGVGSNEQDLFSLADQLPDDYYIISARGPLTLGNGRYAWYNVDFSTGKPVFDTQQENASRDKITAFISQIKKEYHLDEIYLGGFSQGAIMSYSIALTQPSTLKGIIILGGRILEEIKPAVKQNVTLTKLKVFVAHGVQDGTLPIHYARDAKTYLETMQVQLSYHEYNMGHQINADVIKDLNAWLK